MILLPKITDDLLSSLGMPSDAIISALPVHPLKTATLASLMSSKRILYTEGTNDPDALRIFMGMFDETRAAAFFSKWYSSFSQRGQGLFITSKQPTDWDPFWRDGGLLKRIEPNRRELLRNIKLHVAVLMDRDYRPVPLLEIEKRAFASSVEKSPFVADGPNESFWTTWGDHVAEWENYLLDLDAIQSVLRERKSNKIAQVDSLYEKFVKEGES